MDRPSMNDAYTLIEVLVVVALVAFVALALASSATFDISGMLSHIRLKAATTELFHNLQYAKMQAIERNRYCSVTFNQPLNGKTYDYVIYVDPNRNRKYDSDNPDEKLLKKVDFSVHKGVAFDTAEGGGDGNTFADNGDGLPSVAFDPVGMPKSNGFGAGSVYLVGSNGERTKIVVSKVGRIRTEKLN